MEGEKTMKKGVFYSVGVGPGDPELITLKAVRTLERCPVVAAPQTKNGEMLALAIARQAVSLEGKTVVPLHFTMSRDLSLIHISAFGAVVKTAEQVDDGCFSAARVAHQSYALALLHMKIHMLEQDVYKRQPTRRSCLPHPFGNLKKDASSVRAQRARVPSSAVRWLFQTARHFRIRWACC